MVKAQSSPAPHISQFGFAATAGEINLSKDSEWYENTEGHRTLAGAYQGVKICMTDKGFGKVHKWVNSGLVGALRLIQVKEVIDSYPVVMVQLQATDAAQIDRGIIFEYELPFNFRVEKLSDTLVAIRLANNEFIGLVFANSND